MSERDLTITEYRKISITHSRNTFAGYADRFLRRVFFNGNADYQISVSRAVLSVILFFKCFGNVICRLFESFDNDAVLFSIVPESRMYCLFS